MNILSDYINGNHRVRLYSDGTKVKETIDPAAEYFTYDVPENADIKITDKCFLGCQYCHEGSTAGGRHGNLKALESLIGSLRPGMEMAVGGGDAFTHPDFLWFMRQLKDQGVVANVTINQRQLLQHRDTMDILRSEGLVHGIGISLTDSDDWPTFRYIDELGDNVVLHTIAGVLEARDVHALENRKVLILGYKDLRRGHELLERDCGSIRANIEWLRGYLPRLAEMCRCISFDCLGIEQLDPKSMLHMSDLDYASRFQGSDTDVFDAYGNITCATMYIDVPNMQVARMSTAPLDQRYNFTPDDTIETLFRLSTRGYERKPRTGR